MLEAYLKSTEKPVSTRNHERYLLRRLLSKVTRFDTATAQDISFVRKQWALLKLTDKYKLPSVLFNFLSWLKIQGIKMDPHLLDALELPHVSSAQLDPILRTTAMTLGDLNLWRTQVAVYYLVYIDNNVDKLSQLTSKDLVLFPDTIAQYPFYPRTGPLFQSRTGKSFKRNYLYKLLNEYGLATKALLFTHFLLGKYGAS